MVLLFLLEVKNYSLFFRFSKPNTMGKPAVLTRTWEKPSGILFYETHWNIASFSSGFSHISWNTLLCLQDFLIFHETHCLFFKIFSYFLKHIAFSSRFSLPGRALTSQHVNSFAGTGIWLLSTRNTQTCSWTSMMILLILIYVMIWRYKILT